MSDYGFPKESLMIRVAGSLGEVGKVEFTLAGQLVEAVWLPKGEWAVFAILAQAAHTAPDDSGEDHLSADKLARRLRKRDIITRADPQLATRAVSRLRKRLRRLKVVQALIETGLMEESADFSMALIQRTHLLGYRINVHPDDLHLEISEMPEFRM